LRPLRIPPPLHLPQLPPRFRPRRPRFSLQKNFCPQVGTESSVDRAKSIRSYLLQLFPAAGAQLEGADVVHACYGGVAALLNALAWVESEAWDGRWAVVVTTDTASMHPDGGLERTGRVCLYFFARESRERDKGRCICTFDADGAAHVGRPPACWWYEQVRRFGRAAGGDAVC
jgi:hypothetical protein